MARRNLGARNAAPGSVSGLPARWPAIVLLAASLGSVLLAGIGANDPFTAFDRAAIFVGASGFVGALILVITKRLRLRMDLLAASWGAVLVWALLSTLYSGRVWAAFVGERTSMVGWAALVALTLVALAASMLSPQVKRVLTVASPWLLLGESALVAYQLFRGLTPGGSLPNSTYLGEVIVLLLPWVLFSEAASPSRRVVSFAAVFVSLATLAASGSRTALVLAMAWAAWNLVVKSKVRRAARAIAATAALATMAVLIFVFNRVEIMGIATTEMFGERPQMYALATRAVLARPLTGWGPDGFAVGGAALGTTDTTAARTAYIPTPGGFDPHNLVLFVSVSIGLVGLAFVLWFGWEVVRRWRGLSAADGRCAPAIWACVMFVALAMTAPAVVHVLPLFALVLGVSLGPPSRDDGGQKTLSFAASGFVVASLAAVSVLFCANAWTRALYENPSAERSPALAARSVSAARIWGLDPYLAYLASLHVAYAATSDPALGQARTDLALIQRAVALDSRDALYPLELARTLRFYYSPPAEVDGAFLESLRRFPAYPTANAEYGLYLAQTGRLDEARVRIGVANAFTDFTPERIAALQAAQEIFDASGVK